MRLLLLNPPDTQKIASEVPARINAEVSSLPPLGLLYLESYLAKHGDWDIKLLDARSGNLSYQDLEREIAGFSPQVLGLTGHTHNLLDMLEISRMTKALNPDLFIVWGGPHATAFPETAARFPEVSALVVGEGEETFRELLENFARTGGPGDTPGVAYQRAGEVVLNPPRELIRDLDSLPFPRREKLDLNAYFSSAGKGERATSLASSRGCPYRCAFCSTPKTAFRRRSAQNVVDELERCAALGVKEVYLVDDTFNVDKPRVREIGQEILKRGLKIAWTIRARVDLLEFETLKILKQAGLSRIQLGVETASPEGLQALGKDLTPEQIVQGFKMIQKAGITTAAYFMLGLPTEKTKADILATIEFAKKLKPDYCLFGILTLYPGTELYRQALEQGVVKAEVWDKFLTSPYREFRLPTWNRFFTEDQLREYLDLAYRKFYLRGSYVLKNLLETRSLAQLGHKIKAGLGILKQ